MSGLIKTCFRGVDRKKIFDSDYSADYKSAKAFERVRFGRICLYYRDLLKKYFVPYDYIDRVYTKVVVCPENEFANSEEYYRIILVHGDTEFASLIIQKKSTVESIYEELKLRNSNIIIGS